MEFKLEGFLQNRKRTSSHNAAIVTDHLGNQFESVQKMIMAYEITPGKYYYYKIIKQNLIPYITLWDSPKNPRKYFRQQDIIEFIKKRTELSDEEIRQRYLCRY